MTEFSNLKRITYFAAVVESGSFTAAADRLGITKAVVSQQVARLEAEFRTTLLFRTTRKVQPTEAGQAFYLRCATILREAEDAFAGLLEQTDEPSGLLRLTAPLDYGIRVVVPAIAAFMQRYPQCKVDAVLSDQKLDLMDRNIELAVRLGWLDDSQLQARQIGTFRQVLVAPALWRDRLAGVTTPQAIEPLPFVANTILRDPLRWCFSRGTADREDVQLQAALSLDATLPVREAVLHGAGMSVLPDYAVAEDIASGRLIHVLPEWTLPSGGIYVVFPSARFRPPKVRAFVDMLGALARRAETGAEPHGTG